MRIIFLDIDGVLNNQMMYEYYKGDIIKASHGNLDPRCIELLNDLIESTGSKLVLSSTWRFGGQGVIDELKSLGIKGEFVGMTPRSNHGVRGVEIKDWISDNKEIIGTDYWKFNDYVILDDDSDMLLSQNYFRVDAYCGLTPNLIHRVKLFFGIHRF